MKKSLSIFVCIWLAYVIPWVIVLGWFNSPDWTIEGKVFFLLIGTVFCGMLTGFVLDMDNK